VAAAGLQEVFTCPWVSTSMLASTSTPLATLFELAAPPSPELRYLRAALVPNLLEAVATNQHHFDEFGIFEGGAVFPERTEARHLAGVFIGSDVTRLFARAKGLIESLVRRVHLAPLHTGAVSSGPGWFDPAVALALRDGAADEDGDLGLIGRVNNRARRAAGIKRGEIVAFELCIDRLETHATRENRYVPPPAFPQISFDLTFVVPDRVQWRELEAVLPPLDTRIRALVWIGEYRGKGVDEGTRALTFRVRLGVDDRTLTTEEADDIRARVCALVQDRFGGIQR